MLSVLIQAGIRIVICCGFGCFRFERCRTAVTHIAFDRVQSVIVVNDAAAYAVTLHFIQMLLLVITGFIGMRRLKIEFRTIVKEIRANTRSQD